MDDLFLACFGCDNSFQTRFPLQENFIERQTQETLNPGTHDTFQSTRQSRRVICRRTPAGARDCRLRVDRLIQLRQRSYGRSIQFVQNEEYLTQEDLDLVRK